MKKALTREPYFTLIIILFIYLWKVVVIVKPIVSQINLQKSVVKLIVRLIIIFFDKYYC